MKNLRLTKSLFTAITIACVGIANSMAQVSFTTDVITGCVPLTVNFTNTSSAGVTYQIIFDDGSPTGFWSGTDTVHTYTNPGTYYTWMMAFDAQNNFIGQYNHVAIVINTAPTSFSQSATSACPGDDVGFSAYFEPGASYGWSFGDGNNAIGPWVNNTYTTYGTYNISLITNGQCGIDTIVQTLTVDSTGFPDAQFGFYPNPVCPLQPVQFYSYNSNAAAYYWDFGDGNTSTAASPMHPYTTTGLYNAFLVVTNGCGNMDTATAQQVIVVSNASFPPIQLNIYSTPSCPNENVHTDAPPGYLSYLWNAGDGSPADSTTNNYLNHIYSDTGSYIQTCRIYDFCGNDTTLVDTVVIGGNVGFNSGSIGPINVKSPICPGETEYVGASPGYLAYVFDFGDGSPTDSIGGGGGNSQFGHTYTTTGTYVASVKVYNYCGLDTTIYDTVVVTNSAGFQPGLNINFLPVNCPGAEVDMNTFGGHMAYLWRFGDGSPSDSNQYGSSQHIYPDTGTYVISVKIYSFCGVDTTIYDTVKIQNNLGFPPMMNFYGYPNPVCPSDRISLNTDYGYVNYSWDFGDGNTIQTGTNYAVNYYDSVGTYQASVTITNGCGLDTTLSTGILVDTNAPFPPQVMLTASSPVTCPGDVVNFNVGDNFASFFWDFGGNDTLTTTSDDMNHTYDSVGTYTMYVTITNGCGNQITLSKTIVVDSNNTFVDASISVLNNTPCPGDLVSIGPNDDGTSYTYYWDLGDGNVDTTYGFGVSHAYADTGTYIVNVIAVNGCGYSDSSFVTIYVSDNALPSLGSGGDDFYGTAGGESGPAGCAGDAIIFYFAGLYANTWDFGDGSTASATGTITTSFGQFSIITHAYQDTGTYWATLSITNGCGNSWIDSVQVVIGGGLAVAGDLFAEPPTSGSYTTCEGVTFLAMGGNILLHGLWGWNNVNHK